MKRKKILLFLPFVLLMAAPCFTFSQQVTLTKSDAKPFTRVNDADHYNLSLNGQRIFITEKFENAVKNYYQTSYDATGKQVVSQKLVIPEGEFKNGFSIDDIIILGGKHYAMVENPNTINGKNSYSAREIANGVVAANETVVASFSFEKLMKSGDTKVAVSADQKKLVAMSWHPEVKDVLPKLTLAVYDENLVKEREVSIDYAGDMKRASFFPVVGNDGTVYMVKKVMNKIGETELTICFLKSDNTLGEYQIVLPESHYVTSYATAVTPENELVVSGLYRKVETLTVGEPTRTGVFYYTMKGKTDHVFNSFALDKPIENLETNKILLNGSTVFLVTEQYKSVNDDVPAGSTVPATGRTVTHKNNFVIGIDLSGTKKFQIELQKNFVTNNADQHAHTAVFICNGKLTVVYNDDYKKYNEYGESGMVPVVIQITNDGLSSAPVVMKEFRTFGKILLPSFAVQDSGSQLSFLAADGATASLVTFTIAD